VNLLREGIDVGNRTETLLTIPSMFRAAQLVGEAVRQIYRIDGPTLDEQKIPFDVMVLLGGEIKGDMRLFQIYAAGNFIEATPDTPFLQIGEHKYGKPILDRVVTFGTDLYDGVKLVLISMDSTLRSNLTVGMPVDLLVYRRGALEPEVRQRLTEEDAYFKMIRERWSTALRDAYQTIPRASWAEQYSRVGAVSTPRSIFLAGEHFPEQIFEYFGKFSAYSRAARNQREVYANIGWTRLRDESLHFIESFYPTVTLDWKNIDSS
jgi:putative proteasome-type protease